jgi:hypothetical protein
MQLCSFFMGKIQTISIHFFPFELYFIFLTFFFYLCHLLKTNLQGNVFAATAASSRMNLKLLRVHLCVVLSL